MIKYCSKDYEFPQKAYVAIIWFVDDENRLMTAISGQLHKYLSEVESYTKGLGLVLAENDNEVIEVNIFEIEMNKLLANKREYWTKVPREEKDETEKLTGGFGWVRGFLKTPKLFDLLVVPRKEMGGEIVFDLAKTFLRGGNSLVKIEEFMYYSTQVVEPTAKYSAIYNVNDLVVIDWKTGERRKTKTTKISKEDLMD